VRAEAVTRKQYGQEFLDALTQRDFARLGASLAPAVRLRGLITPGPIEEHGPADTVARFRGWFGDADRLETLSSDVSEIADRVHVSYALRVHGDTPAGEGTFLIEQHLFGVVGSDGIQALDLLCSGFRRDAEA
jgi:hypothetical protein